MASQVGKGALPFARSTLSDDVSVFTTASSSDGQNAAWTGANWLSAGLHGGQVENHNQLPGAQRRRVNPLLAAVLCGGGYGMMHMRRDHAEASERCWTELRAYAWFAFVTGASRTRSRRNAAPIRLSLIESCSHPDAK
jgi:hypothetical protein